MVWKEFLGRRRVKYGVWCTCECPSLAIYSICCTPGGASLVIYSVWCTPECLSIVNYSVFCILCCSNLVICSAWRFPGCLSLAIDRLTSLGAGGAGPRKTTYPELVVSGQSVKAKAQFFNSELEAFFSETDGGCNPYRRLLKPHDLQC